MMMRLPAKASDITKILLVDDSAGDRSAIKRSLLKYSGRDLRFVEKASAQEVLELIGKEEFDCLLIDLALPDTSALEFIYALRDENGILPFPVVVVTAPLNEDLGLACLEAGAHDYIYKERLGGPTLWRALCYAKSRYLIARELILRAKELERVNRELSVKNQLKTEFLASATHELRTPITAISGLLELMKSEEVSPQAQVYARKIETCCDALACSINDVIDLSKIESGEFSLSKVAFSPQRAVSDVVTSLELQAADKRVNLVLEIDSLPTKVYGDPKRIRQILLNFGSNAVKFTDEGRIIFRAYFLERSSQICRFEVEDTGCGIPENEVAHVFERHFQASNSNRQGVERGTGLGLLIVKEIVDQMNGTVGCRSTLGKGSTFWFEIPLPTVNCQPEAVSEPSQNLSSRHILLAEDNPVLSRVLRQQLINLGQRVTLAEDGREALDLFDPETIDIVILDARMPRLSGLETSSQIRDTHPAWLGPIYILTADLTLPARDWDKYGVTSILMKPLSVEELKSRVLA